MTRYGKALTFDSMEAFIAQALRKGGGAETITERWDYDHGEAGGKWSWGTTVPEALEMGRMGWEAGLVDAMPIAESAVSYVEREHPFPSFHHVFDVSGGEVDMGRYVTGEPENMIEYVPQVVSKVGRVVTLCASGCFSGSVTAEHIIQRGAAIIGLALALERTGHACELWVDISGPEQPIRILVKSAHDIVDPSRIAYAFGHPTVLRFFAHAHMGAGRCGGRP